MSAETTVNAPFQHDTRVDDIDAELEEIEKQRLALKERGRELMKQKAEVMMREQVILRFTGGDAFTSAEVDWITANPDEWTKIKTDHKRGSRRAQRTTVK